MNATPLTALSHLFSPLRTHPWAYPALEVMHIVGIALLLGSLVLLEIRVWSRSEEVRSIPVRALARMALMVVLVGFSLVLLSGLLMFATQAQELLANRAFVIKMLLLTLAACNAAWFHGRDSLGKLDGLARLQTALSTLIWVAVIACGRWIAYL
jgi:hypothetical protein